MTLESHKQQHRIGTFLLKSQTIKKVDVGAANREANVSLSTVFVEEKLMQWQIYVSEMSENNIN